MTPRSGPGGPKSAPRAAQRHSGLGGHMGPTWRPRAPRRPPRGPERLPESSLMPPRGFKDAPRRNVQNIANTLRSLETNIDFHVFFIDVRYDVGAGGRSAEPLG